jgi:hypothetical protein
MTQYKIEVTGIPKAGRRYFLGARTCQRRVRLLFCISQRWQSLSRVTPPGLKGSNGNLTAVVAASGSFLAVSAPVFGMS